MTSIYGKFKNMEPCRIQQTFDKENIFVTKQGQKINCFDSIQAANVDTNIYEVMKKYHCQENEAIELMKQRGGEQGIYLDIVEIQKRATDIGEMQKAVQEAQTLFEQLPAEIKTKYGNNLEDFFKDQEKKHKEKIEKANQNQTNQNQTNQNQNNTEPKGAAK